MKALIQTTNQLSQAPEPREPGDLALPPGTPKAEREKLNSYLSYVRGSGQAPGTDTLQKYIDTLKNSFSTSYLRNIKQVVKESLLYTYPEIDESEVDTRLKKVKIPKDDKTIGNEKTYTPREHRKLLKALPAKLRLIQYTLHITGLRISELVKAKKDKAVYENGFYILSVIGKGRKQRRVFIPERLFNKILKYPAKSYLFETEAGNPYNRVYINREMKRASLRAFTGERLGRQKKPLSDTAKKRVEKFHPHTARHTFAKQKYKETGNLKAVSLYLGHASTKTTGDMYLHEGFSPEELFPGFKARGDK